MFRCVARGVWVSIVCAMVFTGVQSKNNPLQIDITKGIVAQVPIAIIGFQPIAGDVDIGAVVENDLIIDGGFNILPAMGQENVAQMFPNLSLWSRYPDAMVVQGDVRSNGVIIQVMLRIFDVRLKKLVKTGTIRGAAGQWRLLAHRISNAIYQELTGEKGVFDTQIIFAAQSKQGKKSRSRIAIVDYDGANARFLTPASEYCYAPKVATFSPMIAYGFFQGMRSMLCVQKIGSSGRTVLPVKGIGCSVDFDPNGHSIVFGDAHEQSTTLKEYGLDTGSVQAMNRPYGGIAVSPSHSPDGGRIVIASDQDLSRTEYGSIGAPKLYVVDKKTGLSVLISKGKGSYFSPAWSPDGQYIAFVKRVNGKYFLGVMDSNGANERMIACDHAIDYPSWATNSRKIIFAAQQRNFGPFHLYVVDLTGRHLRQLPVVINGQAMSGNQPSCSSSMVP